MSSGSGNGFLDDIVNVTSQIATSGMVGYGDQGFNLDKGVIGKSVLSGTKEITGAKAAEDANNIARDQFNQSIQQAETARANQTQQSMNNQLQASNGATTARGTTSGTTARVGQTTGDVTDFLGL